ncbi:hypothetical protein [Methylomonas lenta]|nr:hypothetical protein [Methylomonas lenta]
MKRSTPPDTRNPNLAKHPQDWRPEERLQALHDSHGLTEDALNGW